MISHGKDIKIFSGNSNPELAKAICAKLQLPLGLGGQNLLRRGERHLHL